MLFCDGLGECRGHRLEPEWKKEKLKGKHNYNNKSLKIFNHGQQIQAREKEQKQTKKIHWGFI